jgi:predicted MPP superfamily phosphohydrolase
VAVWIQRALRRGAAAGALAAAALVAYAHLVEPRRLRVERWTVRVPNLPLAWEGMRVVQLSDFQIGMWLQDARIPRRAIEAAVALQPDLILLTGDFMHRGRWSGPLDLFTPLTRRAPTVAVLGNHDHKAGAAGTATIVAALRAQGVTVLMNEHTSFAWRGDAWTIVGVDDPATRHTDFLHAITGIPRDTRLLALLTHVPEFVEYLPDRWFPLIVAGHTHGGQIWIPPLLPPGWPR